MYLTVQDGPGKRKETEMKMTPEDAVIYLKQTQVKRRNRRTARGFPRRTMTVQEFLCAGLQHDDLSEWDNWILQHVMAKIKGGK